MGKRLELYHPSVDITFISGREFCSSIDPADWVQLYSHCMPARRCGAIQGGSSTGERIQNCPSFHAVFFYDGVAKGGWEHRVVGTDTCPAVLRGAKFSRRIIHSLVAPHQSFRQLFE